MKLKTFLLGIFIGGAAGAVGTLLSTPQSGREARQKLSNNTQAALLQLSELKDDILDLKEKSLHASKEGQTVILAFISDVKTAVDSWKQSTEQNQAVIKTEIIEIERAIKDLETNLK